jgi:LAS superfamily LD-carboxypeptidase LdcB
LTARSATPNTSGIDTNAVLRFANQGSGTQSNFDQLDSDFKSRILKMAQDYKDKTGSSVTITSAYRSAADQERIYQSWLAAGGHIPDRPTAGGITTPAKPVSSGGKGSPHNSGVAIDSSESKAIARTVDLAQYGLRWGGTFSKPDDVHIQLSSVTP